jgi:N-methylhydantoinase A/oxoprolinase/acetone carboxylase beta subunit
MPPTPPLTVPPHATPTPCVCPLLLQDEALDAAGTAAAFQALTAEVNAAEAGSGKPPKSTDEVAMGFIRVANEAMCRPIRWGVGGGSKQTQVVGWVGG